MTRPCPSRASARPALSADGPPRQRLPAARARRLRVRDRRLAVRRAARGRPEWSRVGAARGVRAGGRPDGRVRGARDRVPAQRLRLQHGRRHLQPDDTDGLQGGRGVVFAGRLAAAVGLAAVAVVEPRAVPDARAHARRGGLRDRDPARVRRLLHLADGLLREPLRDHPSGAGGRRRAWIRCCASRR